MTFLLLLIACEKESEVSFGDQDTAAGSAEQTAADDTGAEAPPLPEYSGGSCPDLSEGTHTFQSAGIDRTVRVELPADPVGAPVVFAWHWLGGNADQIVEWLYFDREADERGMIVVAPESCCGAFEWLFLAGPEDNEDLILFDDTLSCLYEQYQVDLDRVWATGMSAGGLWTSYLTLHRAEWLASTAPMSGGTDRATYTTPADAIPVLLTWGGPSDTYGGFDFDEANQLLSEDLQDDGHFVVECVHSLGHNIPPEVEDYLLNFLEDHPKGVDPEPYASGLPGFFPDWCSVP